MLPATRPDGGGSESDLSRVDKGVMQKVFPGWDYQVVLDPRQADYSTAGPVPENVPAERGAIGADLGALGAVVRVDPDCR